MARTKQSARKSTGGRATNSHSAQSSYMETIISQLFLVMARKKGEPRKSTGGVSRCVRKVTATSEGSGGVDTPNTTNPHTSSAQVDVQAVQFPAPSSNPSNILTIPVQSVSEGSEVGDVPNLEQELQTMKLQ
ncbi:hypothetical protein D9758_010137 [Tetrapyrgos nigripes]|uniref:Uncharacterized protein n=1 Tax=Tetrapyrgos nigripes TaxID=182062 RepID=A0A8H5FS00_9AGAR|nr:hypothetical protein D9758_010137 [Tetrapyrgos nigripes]